jgi:penicillin-binding protein 1A
LRSATTPSGSSRPLAAFFDSRAGDLTLVEAATLVGMLKGPSYYNPVRHPERAKERRNVVLARMHELGTITASEYREAIEKDLVLDFQPGRPSGTIAPHFAEYVQSYVGEWAERRGYDIYSDGLQIHTTLDTRIQAMANKAVTDQAAILQRAANNEWSSGGVAFAGYWAANGRVLDDHLRRTAAYRRLASSEGPTNALRSVRADAALVDSVKQSLTRLQAGFVAIDPADGAVKAWVGGTDHRFDQHDKVAQAKRQPGSAFKPIVYTAAVDFGFSPYSTIRDTLVTVQLPGLPPDVDTDERGRWLFKRDDERSRRAGILKEYHNDAARPGCRTAPGCGIRAPHGR